MLEAFFASRAVKPSPVPALPPSAADTETGPGIGLLDPPEEAEPASPEPAPPAAAEPLPVSPRVPDPGVAEDAASARIAELEEQLRSTLERLGRRTTEVRNLEARLRVMDPLVEQVRQRDQWLDEARKEVRRALGERDAEIEKRRALETDFEALRREIDWRDFVIRDLEGLPDQMRERDQAMIRIRREHAAAIAGRDVEIERLRAKVDELQRKPV